MPTGNDTAVVRSGEAKIAQDFGGVIKVETAGTFRVTASVSAPDVRLQGGTLRSYTSTPLFTLTTVLTAEKASTVNVGSAGTSVFQIAGTLQGSGDLTKTGIGVLQITAASANYKGMWYIKEGVLQVSSASGLGLCGAVAESSSTINIATASATNTITLKTGAKIDLGADLTVQSAVLGSTNLAAGKYNAAEFPGFITGTGSLIVAQNLMQPSSPNKGSITLTAGSGSSYSWYNGTNLAGSSAAYTPAVSGIYTLLATNQAGCTATSSPIYVQVIPLETGWNLISANLRPADSSIAVLFKGLDVQEIKSMDAFWQKNQQPMLNSQKTITIGNGYLVRMNTAGTLSISGIPVSDTQTFSQANPSWQIIGCPYQNQTPFSSIFNTSNCSVIKNFSGFWAPSGTTSSLSGFDPGKAYFMKK